MITILAQAQTPSTDPSVLDTIKNVFSRADTLAHPEKLLTHLQTLSVVWAVIFLVAGMVCLFSGYRFYRAVTVIVALIIGMTAGYALGLEIRAPYVVAGCTGLLLAVICFPMMKYAVAVLGGLTGTWIGANVWTSLCYVINRSNSVVAEEAAAKYWVGALIGTIVCGMLAFILFKLSVVLFTSVSGSTLAVLGVLALLLHFKPWEEQVRSSLSAHAMTIPILVFVPALIGLILQEATPEPVKSKD
jgi:hypothetical protein